MRVAIVNVAYIGSGGAEQVDEVLGQMFPDADLFALFLRDCAIPKSLTGRVTHCSPLTLVPKIDKIYRAFYPLYPWATETLDLRGYDLVISSDHGTVKGVLLDQDTVHICYCHTPWRQLYDLYRLSRAMVPWPLKTIYGAAARHLRQWDFVAAQRVDRFVANSNYIARRIHKWYHRNSTVIYPPVRTNDGYIDPHCRGDYYLSVGRLSHTKRLDVLIEACNRLGRRLLISGEGRDEKRLKAMSGPTVQFLGRVPDKELAGLYANCRAFLFAADEDFGIVPVEAQSYGRPVIAYGHGGSLETVRVNDPEGKPDTGVYFGEQNVNSILESIQRFELVEDRFDPEEIQKHARQFDTSVFKSRFDAYIHAAIDATSSRRGAHTIPSGITA